jgi:hypothetical protein
MNLISENFGIKVFFATQLAGMLCLIFAYIQFRKIFRKFDVVQTRDLSEK